MLKKAIVVVTLTCFSIAVFTGHMLSRARASDQRPLPAHQTPEMLQRPSDDERAKAIEKRFMDREQQVKQKSREYINRMATEAWKRLLRVNNNQWAAIEPKINKVYELARIAQVRTFGSRDDAESYKWNRPSRQLGPMSGKTRDQMPKGYRIIEEVIDLLEDENSKDEQIRLKIEELQQVRENAREELAEVGKQLSALPLTPRQEAILLIVGYID